MPNQNPISSVSDSTGKNQNSDLIEQNQISIKTVFIVFVIFITVIISLIYFKFLHSYEASHYENLLLPGMSLNNAQQVVPQEIYYRHPYPHPMSQPKPLKEANGSEVWWLFEDGSILKTDFNDAHGLRTFEVDISRTIAGNTFFNVIALAIMIIALVFFFELIMHPRGLKRIGN